MAANESAAVAACKIYAETQQRYRASDRDDDGVLAYAWSLRDLQADLGADDGPGEGFAAAEGLPGVVEPHAGYVFKVLTAQGAHVKGGALSYADESGNLTKGFALVACPAEYDESGRNTFVIDAHGTVYQQDLGPDSAKLFEAMTEFDPDNRWVVAE